MIGVERNGEQRALLPFEDVPLALALLPDLGRAAAFDDEHDFLVEMPLDIERAGARHFDDIDAPQALGAEELDVGAAAAEPLPRLQRQILHAAHADAAIDRHAFGLHEPVIGQRLALEFAEARRSRRPWARASGPRSGVSCMAVSPMPDVAGFRFVSLYRGVTPLNFVPACARSFLQRFAQLGRRRRHALDRGQSLVAADRAHVDVELCASARYCGSFCTARKAACSALARAGGRSGGAANGRDKK